MRGAAGDLKVEGEMRVYLGHGNIDVDPLIYADKGDQAPAFRDCAYVVFENLQLADYGNRIPAVTFEIFTEDDTSVSLKKLVPDAKESSETTPLPNTRGFADEGGPLSSTLSAIDRVYPLTCATTKEGLRLTSEVEVPNNVVVLPEQLSSQSNNEAQDRNRIRTDTAGREPLAVRYYDEERDYQPGVQRAIGLRPNGRENMVDLPATMTADGAKALANENAQRARWRQENIIWRVGELNPAIELGTVVALPTLPGHWRVTSWEWFDRGIELGLQRIAPGGVSTSGADTGIPAPPSDHALSTTLLRLFEAPQENSSNPAKSLILAAASSEGAAWFGASLYEEQGSSLNPIGSSNPRRAVFGYLIKALEPSAALMYEPNAIMELQLAADDLNLSDTDVAGLAAGANRLLVGNEVVQFKRAEAVGGSVWRLCGLLRGRAGTEEYALTPHAEQTEVILLDNRLTDLSEAGLNPTDALRVAAIGRGDADAVFATLQNAGLSRRPPTPVHPQVIYDHNSALSLQWIRRARGQWRWDVDGEIPLVEEEESYVVGYGPIEDPFAVFAVSEPLVIFTQADQEALISDHGPANLWVRQVGTYSRSSALYLTSLS
ncbi:MAG: phage tail protein [Pseudomonadota bacterium]